MRRAEPLVKPIESPFGPIRQAAEPLTERPFPFLSLSSNLSDTNPSDRHVASESFGKTETFSEY